MTVDQRRPDQQKPRITVVCKGKTYLDSGHIGIVFLDLDDGGALCGERISTEKNLKLARVGSVYEVEVDPNNLRAIYPATLRWRRLWENHAEAATWQTLADSFDTRDLAIKQERKQTSRKLPVELPAPLREQYWSTNAAGRLAIEVRVLAYLRQERISTGRH